MINRDLTKFFENVAGVVEATNFEHLCLWQKYHKELKHSWVDTREGRFVTVGKVKLVLPGIRKHKEFPVCVQMTVDVINGFKILFMEPTSIVVYHEMVEHWLMENLPVTARRHDGEYLNKVDSMNFWNVIPHGHDIEIFNSRKTTDVAVELPPGRGLDKPKLDTTLLDAALARFSEKGNS